jgi:hypothetical protein
LLKLTSIKIICPEASAMNNWGQSKTKLETLHEWRIGEPISTESQSCLPPIFYLRITGGEARKLRLPGFTIDGVSAFSILVFLLFI